MLRELSSNKAFSLTELSIAMMIIAVIASSAISVAITSDYYAKYSQTQTKLDRIEEALRGFLILNKRLPCPADGSLAITNASFATEGTPDSTQCQGVAANFKSGNVYVGVVPATTLQLPDDFTFDGWGNRITYAVDYRFANNTVTNSNCDGVTSTVCFIDTASGAITINDASGTARTTGAIYVLVSHGENGHGAFPKNGGSTRINYYIDDATPYTSVAERENSHFSTAGADTGYNATFVMKDYIRVEGGGEYFDDIVRFSDKRKALKDAGVIFYDGDCRNAQKIIDNPSSNSCTNAADESTCMSFADEIVSRCL